MTTGSALYIPPYKADNQDVVVELNTRFGPEAFTAQATRTGMPVLWVNRAKLVEVLTFLRNLPKPYVMLYDLHGVDERLRTKRQGLPSGADFTVFYHLMSLERNSDVMIKVALSEKDLSVPTVTGIWPNANWYEREVWDMFGIDFKGHPHLSRIKRPLGHITCTRKFTKGSDSGWLEVTRNTLLPSALMIGVKRKSSRNAGRGTPALLNSCSGARLGTTCAAVRSLTSSSSISASSGWFCADLSVSSPSSSACAIPDDSAEAAAIANTNLRT